jgi:hypothetical protein
MRRWDGTGFTKVYTAPTTQNLYAIHAISDREVWAAGPTGGLRCRSVLQHLEGPIWPGVIYVALAACRLRSTGQLQPPL